MRDAKDLLKSEQKIALLNMVLISACALTGLITFIFTNHTIWQQWVVLSHLLIGIACTFVMIPYLYIHFRRTLGFRRASVLLSGLLSVLLFLMLSISGWYILLNGLHENKAWIYQVHILAAFVFIVIILLHVIQHVKKLPLKRKKRMVNRFPSLPFNVIFRVGLFNGLIQLIIIFIVLFYYAVSTSYSEEPQVGDYQYNYGSHRFRPSQTETSNGAFIDKKQIANSDRCISCHQDIAEQWISSVHREAASDPTYVTNINLLEKNKGISATRYCEGCHAPVALLTGELSSGGKHGGVAGSIANLEGISCMGCHGIDSLVHLKGVASFQFTPAKDYLFSQSQNSLLLRLSDLLIRVKPDQHKKDLGKPLFKDPKFCSACHTQFMDKEMNNWGWVKMQDEYAAWSESPYSKQHEEGFSDADISRCQDCHMPLLDSKDPSANLDGKIRSHHFPGANTFLPLLRGDMKQLDAVKTFLKSNKLRVTIDKPSRVDALQTTHALDEDLRDFKEAPYFYYLGETAKINAAISNVGVGHDFPGGTIDINEAWVEVQARDAEGRLVFISGEIGPDNYVDPEAYFYRSLPVDRQGRLVWKHDLFNMIGESFKRVIKAGESDIVSYDFVVPYWAKTPLNVTVTLKYRKLNERYARWALKDRYVEIPVVDLAWDSLVIPVKIRKNVANDM